jgi:hypothetical protein
MSPAAQAAPKQAWRSRTGRIRNLCRHRRVGLIDSIRLAAHEIQFRDPEPVGEHLIWAQGSLHVFTVWMPCCDLPRAGSFSGSLRAIRSRSSRFLRDGSLLCREIFDLHRRDVGAKPGRERRRDRGGAELPPPRARAFAAGLALESDAVGRCAISLSVEPDCPRAKRNRAIIPPREAPDGAALIRAARRGITPAVQRARYTTVR